MCAAANAWGMLRRMVGPKGERAAMDALRTTESLARTFSFYTTPSYRFHNEKLMGLTARFGASDNASFPVDARQINSPHYLCRTDVAGLTQYALRRRRIPAPTTASESLPVDAAIESPAA